MPATRRLGVRSALVEGRVVPGDVALADGAVESVGLAPAPGARGLAVPGFVDWQVNGFGGVHFGDADAGGYGIAAAELARAGIVWAAPTLFSMGLDGYTEALGVLDAVRRADPASGFTGAHLEGPFLSPSWAGAHDPSTFVGDEAGRGTCARALERLLGAGPVAMVTVAPEVAGVAALVPVLRSSGVAVGIGHSDATVSQCREAAVLGAGVLTHCWNAHRRLSARDPGPAGWALAAGADAGTGGPFVGLVADGVHVAPEVLALTFAAAPGRVSLTTDAVAPAGSGARSGVLGGRRVVVDGGAVRLPDGTLAGSVATPSDMLRVCESAGVAVPAAIEACSRPQARVLGLGEWRMRPGDPAHVTVLGDAHEVLAAYRAGARLG